MVLANKVVDGHTIRQKLTSVIHENRNAPNQGRIGSSMYQSIARAYCNEETSLDNVKVPRRNRGVVFLVIAFCGLSCVSLACGQVADAAEQVDQSLLEQLSTLDCENFSSKSVKAPATSTSFAYRGSWGKEERGR